MKFWERIFRPDPKDKEQLKRACDANRRAQEQLDRANEMSKEVVEVTGQLRDLRIENHFGEAIRKTFELNNKPPKKKRRRS